MELGAEEGGLQDSGRPTAMLRFGIYNIGSARGGLRTGIGGI